MTKTVSTQRTTITEPAVNQDPNARSIRQIMLQGILTGATTQAIKDEVVRCYPTSAAATKFSKHLAWYKAWLKKNPAKPDSELGLIAAASAE